MALIFETYLKLDKLQCKCNFNRNEVFLLNIDNFEPNQIFLYLRGGYMMHFETTCHVSHVTCHVQHVTFQPIPNLTSYGPANFLIMFTTPYHVSCVPCHKSGVTCHLSLVRCHMSGVTCHNFFLFFFNKVVEFVCVGSVIDGAYPVLFLDFLLLKTP